MTNFYTNVQCFGNSILYRGIMNGKRVNQRIDYQPSLYIPSRKTAGSFKSLDGTPLDRKKFDDIREAKEFTKKYDGIPGCLLYTSPSPRDGLLSRMPSSA